MNRTEAIAWVLSVCANTLRLSQAKTLSVIVAAAIACSRISLGNLGRQMPGTAKHQIKRAYRFIHNSRIEPTLAMAGPIRQLVKRRKKPLLIGLDWTDVRGLTTLMAAAVIGGRAVPLCWASCPRNVYEGHRSRNAFEESLLGVLRTMVPARVKVILLADRGFGRTSLAKFCREQGFSYLIRIQPKVHIASNSFTGKLLDYQMHKGISRKLSDVRYRQDQAVCQHVVVHWAKNLPKKRDECWFLMTDLPGTARQLIGLYAKRMSVEQLFRDLKNKRNGWSLRDTGIRDPQRFDRLLLILALAYLLVCGAGLLGRLSGKPSMWCSNNRTGECSVFAIGLILIHGRKLRLSPTAAFQALFHASDSAAPNWG
ncbi:MAG: hypothetical protein BIFFINMI_03820 [Phycisphaerae bacterium]|nr:hypothetical protein [Phycisphaerae bacterium]